MPFIASPSCLSESEPYDHELVSSSGGPIARYTVTATSRSYGAPRCFGELPCGAFADRWGIERVIVVASNARHEAFVGLVERNDVGLDLYVERAVDPGRAGLMRLVREHVAGEQRLLDRMRALELEQPAHPIDVSRGETLGAGTDNSHAGGAYLRYAAQTRPTSVCAPKPVRTKKKAPRAGPSNRALCRTRTGDPFLTMEVLYQLS
jgi:hypothetical protein